MAPVSARVFLPARACLQSFTIRPGQSSYPVSVAAFYNQCGQGRPEGTIKACLPGGHPPPLPRAPTGPYSSKCSICSRFRLL
jgi:hypothetical protein